MHSAIQENIQTKIIFLHSDDSLEFAYANMVRNETKSCLVLNNKKELVGIVSDVELNRSLKSGIQDSGKHKFSTLRYDPNGKVSDYMCTNFIIVNNEQELESLFNANKTPGACIIYKLDKKIKGFMTCKDILKAVEAYCSQPQAL